MPLCDFASPAITNNDLENLDISQLADLLLHKTNGLLIASRTHLGQTELGKKLKEEVQRIQKEIKDRTKSKLLG
jgi:hypothetical protein